MKDYFGARHRSFPASDTPPTQGRLGCRLGAVLLPWGWTQRCRGGETNFLLRTSLGRHREDAALDLDDAELVARSLADLRTAVGLHATPYDHAVTRWRAGLPQYPVGHLDRVARIRTHLDALGAIAVCGAAYDGVGIPAVVAGARRAAELLTPGTGTTRTEGTMGS